MNAFLTSPGLLTRSHQNSKSSFITPCRPLIFNANKVYHTNNKPSIQSIPCTITAKKKSPKKTDQNKSPSPSPASSFTGMAAGPGAPTKRVSRSLGKRKPVVTEDIEKKTAADFIAEGIEDDVEDFEDFNQEDMRFGIDDVKDPFLIDANKEEKEKTLEETKVADALLGQELDVTGDGAVIKFITKSGTGGVVPDGAEVTVKYTGYLEDGTEFDTSTKSGDGTFTFQIGQGSVIKGWEAGIATMRQGETAKLTIQPNYAYGRKGIPPVIPRNSTLTFEIEVVSTEGGKEEDIQRVKDFNPDIARTPIDIARDYDTLLVEREEKKKNRSFLDRFYIISPFASQSGEKPPWWINPNITFFIIVVSVAIGFYLVTLSGAIHIGYVEEPIDVNIFK